MKVICPHCKQEIEKKAGDINRAKNRGARIFCSKKCSGVGRRNNKTTEQKKAEKSAYDKQYRMLNEAKLKIQKAERHKRVYDPEKQRVYNQNRMKHHVEYCRKPEYKTYKAEYDQSHRAKNKFGEFWESAILVEKLSDLIDNREANQIKGTINKSLKRKRAWLRTKKSNLPQLP